MPSIPPPETVSPMPPPQPAPEPPRADADEPPWRVWTAPAAVAVGLVFGLMGTILVEAVGTVGGSSLTNPSPAVSIISDIVFDLGFVTAALYFARLQAPVRLADFGFRRIRLKLAIGAFVVAGLGYYVITDVWAALFALHGTDKLPSELGVGKSTAALVGAAIFVCVLAPMAEEFFFRGFIFGALRRWRIRIAGRDVGTWLAAVVTGILFGLAHTGSAASEYLIPLGFLGFVLCLVRWRTRSLYPCMALHSVNNSLALGINQLNWNGAEILGLTVASLAVIAALTGPLSRVRPAPA